MDATFDDVVDELSDHRDFGDGLDFGLDSGSDSGSGLVPAAVSHAFAHSLVAIDGGGVPCSFISDGRLTFGMTWTLGTLMDTRCIKLSSLSRSVCFCASAVVYDLGLDLGVIGPEISTIRLCLLFRMQQENIINEIKTQTRMQLRSANVAIAFCPPEQSYDVYSRRVHIGKVRRIPNKSREVKSVKVSVIVWILHLSKPNDELICIRKADMVSSFAWSKIADLNARPAKVPGSSIEDEEVVVALDQERIATSMEHNPLLATDECG